MAIFNIKTDLVVQYQNTSGVMVAIQADTIEVDIDRGITVESGVFARPDTGTMTVRMMKSSLSDLLTSPGYRSNQLIQVLAQGQSLFYGIIQNIQISYMVETKQIEVTITANDFAKIFSNLTLTTFTIPSGAHSTRNFKTCMSYLNSAISTLDSRMSLTQYGTAAGATSQYANVWYDTQAGEIVSGFLDAELGWMFTTNNGSNMFYMTRYDVDALQGTTWSNTRRTISNVHSTSSYHVCMNAIDMSYDSDNLANYVTVTDPSNSTTRSASNSTSISTYGRQDGKYQVEFDYSTGAPSTLTQWAQAVATAANPKSIKSVLCPAVKRDGNLSPLVAVEVADVQQVEFAATGYTTLQEIYLVTRVKHNITAEHWEITLDLWRGI